ncbi:MAG: hypothetical protein V4726_08615 [Verrucomicrobiota bacterium]
METRRRHLKTRRRHLKTRRRHLKTRRRHLETRRRHLETRRRQKSQRNVLWLKSFPLVSALYLGTDWKTSLHPLSTALFSHDEPEFTPAPGGMWEY